MNNLHKIKSISLSDVELANIWHHYRNGGFKNFIIVNSATDGINMIMSRIGYKEECTINHYIEYLSNKKINQNFLKEITIERKSI